MMDKETQLSLRRSFGSWRAVDLRVKVAKRRWCKDCWKGASGLWGLIEEMGYDEGDP